MTSNEVNDEQARLSVAGSKSATELLQENYFRFLRPQHDDAVNGGDIKSLIEHVNDAETLQPTAAKVFERFGTAVTPGKDRRCRQTIAAEPIGIIAGPSVQCEGPLLAMRILETANVTILGVPIDEWWITAGSGEMVRDLQEWFRH